MSWTEVKSRWSSTWTALYERAKSSYDAAISANPIAYRDKVAGFMGLLSESRASLDRIKAQLAMVDDPELQAQATQLESRYATLAAGVYADAKATDEMGVAPFVVGGVVVAGVLIGHRLGRGRLPVRGESAREHWPAREGARGTHRGES